jgi:alpha-mannosidase
LQKRTLGNLFQVSEENIIIETIKPYEKGEGTIVRLYESIGLNTGVRLDINFGYQEVYETNLLEQSPYTIDRQTICFTPYEIKTLLIL